MPKKVIRLTEGDLHNIIKESVNNILKEFSVGSDSMTRIQNALDNGEEPERIFNKIEPANNGAFIVYRDGYGVNLMTQNKKLIFPEWFREIHPFWDGFALAQYKNLSFCYIKDKTFETIGPFQSAGLFTDGYASVRYRNKNYALGTDGKFYNVDIIEHPHKYKKQ